MLTACVTVKLKKTKFVVELIAFVVKPGSFHPVSQPEAVCWTRPPMMPAADELAGEEPRCVSQPGLVTTPAEKS
jgi:hypothetical protein